MTNLFLTYFITSTLISIVNASVAFLPGSLFPCAWSQGKSLVLTCTPESQKCWILKYFSVICILSFENLVYWPTFSNSLVFQSNLIIFLHSFSSPQTLLYAYPSDCFHHHQLLEVYVCVCVCMRAFACVHAVPVYLYIHSPLFNQIRFLLLKMFAVLGFLFVCLLLVLLCFVLF